MAATVAISANLTGTTVVVPAVSGYTIKVLHFVLSFSSGAVNVQWRDGTGANLTGVLYGPLTGGAPTSIAAGEVAPAAAGCSPPARARRCC
jgi:hypothetical protein